MALQRFRTLIERAYVVTAVWADFLEEEARAGFRGFDRKRWTLLSKGFHHKRTIPYDLAKWRFSEYISDFEQKKLQFVNHPYNKLLNNKLIFSTYFGTFFRTPRCYCIVEKGRIAPVNRNDVVRDVRDLTSLAERAGKLIVKPLEGMDAQGIHLVTHSERGLEINYARCGAGGLEPFIRSLDGYLVEEFIEQGAFTRTLHPTSSNTLRVITLIDPSSSEPFIPIATLRIGTSRSAPVDFFPLGGLIAYIDVETGELSEAMAMGKDGGLVFSDHHPETKVPIKGLVVPGWKRLAATLLETAGTVAPLLKVVGWDVVVTDDGFAVIEGNSGPDTKIQGLDRPLARDPRVLGFLRHHGIR